MRVLVVTPTYLEAENIEEYLRRLRAAAPDVDVLVVDDGSPDGTAELAERLGEELGSIEVLRRPGKTGLGVAYRAGFAVGLERGYDVLIQMDADLSHAPEAVPDLLAPLEAGADVVVGSRYVPGGSIPHWPWHRRALSRYGNLYASLLLRSGVVDATSGYRAYKADVLRRVDVAATRATGYGFQIEMAYRVVQAGGKIVEIPITFVDRVAGVSKMTLKVASEELVLVTRWGVRDRIQDLRRRLRQRHRR
jgi:dolichol-phosphate mannosyltransferase